MASTADTRLAVQRVLDYCVGGSQKLFAPGDLFCCAKGEGGPDNSMCWSEGRIEIVKGEMVVATTAEPGAIFGETAILLNRDHSASVRVCIPSTVYMISDAKAFLHDRAGSPLLIARMLAQTEQRGQAI